MQSEKLKVKDLNKKFFAYVTQNILGTMSITIYILADALFVSLAVGSNGLAALNLILPVFALIFAIGEMLGIGSAIQFSINKGVNKNEKAYLMNAVEWGVIFGMMIAVAGAMIPEKIIAILGGNNDIIQIGVTYTRICMIFAPFFILTRILNAFVRNDGSPSIAMAGTVISSLFNIVFDYIFIFVCGWGMKGAALATAFSPIIGISICMLHWIMKRNTIKFGWHKPSVSLLIKSVRTGISAFVGEISQGIVTLIFNMLILRFAGNVGVAAYGIIANVSMLAFSVLNGIAQGSQPLVSSYYGKNDVSQLYKVRKLTLLTSGIASIAIFIVIVLFAEPIVSIFNSENNADLMSYAMRGMYLYFIGILVAGYNISATSILSAVESVKYAFWASISRGLLAVIICALVLSALLGIDGVWLSFLATEVITAFITFTGLKKLKIEKEVYRA
ncbi:MAG: MATE family efflux transporter [Lachnospiraceae bacterium]|nr:MATE family efflux transporter [Lachnospiraceae bacterium]